jgi:predicted NUDIX family NTP pyrophosphohydrolase
VVDSKGRGGTPRKSTARAQLEFEEELGIQPRGDWRALGSIKQRGGKIVHAWAFEGDLEDSFQLRSNKFELEWPPGSGRREEFPEIDQAVFFPEEMARRKINPAQVELLDRLGELT